ncbi:31640_t:CDS:1, partial [Racocetra persica]
IKKTKDEPKIIIKNRIKKTKDEPKIIIKNRIKKIKDEQKINAVRNKNKILQNENKKLNNEIKKLNNVIKRLNKLNNKSLKNQKSPSNVEIGKSFENEISKILKSKGVLCYVVGGSGDYGIDIFAIYKQKLILIQCKCQESSLGTEVVIKMHSAINMIDGCFGVIVYDSRKLVHNDSRKLVHNDSSLTPNASSFLQGICPQVKIATEKDIFQCIVKMIP